MPDGSFELLTTDKSYVLTAEDSDCRLVYGTKVRDVSPGFVPGIGSIHGDLITNFTEEERIVTKEPEMFPAMPKNIDPPKDKKDFTERYKHIAQSAWFKKAYVDKNEWPYVEAGSSSETTVDLFSRREMEAMFCYGLLNQQDVTVDKLSEQMKTMDQDKIDKIIETIKAMRHEKI